jgi:hypothetical protein
VTRDQLLADLLLERYQPTRAEGVGGWALGPDDLWDDSELSTARRRRVLLAAEMEHEGARNWRSA